jgi:predicted secreted protein
MPKLRNFCKKTVTERWRTRPTTTTAKSELSSGTRKQVNERKGDCW